MSIATRKFHRRARWSAALIALAAATAPLTVSAEPGASPPGTVLRGSLTGGIWVELAHDGQNYAELAILDGLPGGPPQPQFVPLTTNRASGNCSLASFDGSTLVSPCPFNGAYSASISIGAMTGTATLQDVGWTGSYAWGQPNAPTVDIRTQCSLPSLSKAAYLSATPLASPLSVLSRNAQSLPARQTGSAAELSRLRADRLKAYAALTLNADEALRAKQVEDSVAGRPVLGRTVSLADATRNKLAFDNEVLNQPARIQAREDLLQIDRALSAIYDVEGTVERLSLVTKLKDFDLPSALRALDDTLALRQPGSVIDLIQLESAAADLDNCGAALGLSLTTAARTRVRNAMVQRGPDIVSAIRVSVNASAGSAAARTTLQSWESNAAVRSALAAAGETEIFDEVRGKVLQLAAAEEKVRIEAEKQAALEAERDKIPPTTAGADFDYARIERSVVLVEVASQRGNFRGSGFIVAPGIVVTNAHVVDGGTAFAIVPNNSSERIPAMLVIQSNRRDLAILKAPTLKGKTVALASNDAVQGADIYAVGFPGMADQILNEYQVAFDAVVASVNRGTASRPIDAEMGHGGAKGTSRTLQHDANVGGGSSGGAVFDACHVVVGVHTQTRYDETGKRNVKYAISSQEVIALMNEAGFSPVISSKLCK